MMHMRPDSFDHDVSVILPRDVVDGLASGVLEPEKRLMLAVLERAVGDFQTYATAPTGRGRRLFVDADAWFRASARGVFDFETICQALGFDPASIRDGLRRWCTVRRQESAASRTILRFASRRTSERRRAILVAS